MIQLPFFETMIALPTFEFLQQPWVLPIFQSIIFLNLSMDIVRMDPQAFQKNQKRHFFRDIQKSFQEVTPIGPEPHQFFSF